MRRVFFLLTAWLMAFSLPAAEPPAKKTSREALQAFNDAIGSWRATGTPEGTKAEKQNGSWNESVAWEWQFKKDETCLKLTFAKGKYWTAGELSYLPDKDRYRLILTTTEKETLTYEGTLAERVLTLERGDAKKDETQRFVFRFLHANRYLCQYEVKPKDKESFRRVYQIGATKEGEPFAAGAVGPECIVSGGAGTIKVSHKGQTYYVCCSGCRDAFKDDPEKFIKEYEAKQKAK